MIDEQLLAILRCPLCQAEVGEQKNFLVCSKCRRQYPIEDGIPVMLVERAVVAEEHPANASPDD